MTRSYLLASIFLVAAISAPAAAAPDWCSAPDVKRISVSGLSSLYTETKAHDALYMLVGATCNPDAEARAQAKQIEITRIAWSKKLAMTEADWADVAVWATRDQQSRMNGSLAFGDGRKAYAALSGADQYELFTRTTDVAYLADALGARLTQAGRLGYVTRCLEGKEMVWAMCQPDIEALDPAKLSAELRTDPRDGFDRTRLRIEAYVMATTTLPAHARDVEALIKQDAGYAKLFAASKAARADWAKTDKDLVALADAMDDARITNSRKATEGCGDKTWAALRAQIAKLPAKTFSGIEAAQSNPFLRQAMAKVIATPDGYLAALAFAQCAVLTKQADYLSSEIADLMGWWPGYRGPRTAAHTTVLATGVELDQQDAKIAYPDVERRWLRAGSIPFENSGTGTLESVKPKDGGAVVATFAKVKGTQLKCVRGKSTNRVTQIRSDGTFVYEYICLEEKWEAYASPPAPPATVLARYTDGVEAGAYVSIVSGVVTAVYRKGGKQPTHIAGVPVK